MGLLLGSQAWADDCQLKDYGTLPVEMVGNQATTMVKINGKDTRFIIDTGASFNTMSSANASVLGLPLQPAPFGYRITGVGGEATVQQTHVKEFGILDTTLKNIAFIVGGTDTGEGLLGANLLDLADLEIDLAHGKLTLFKAEHCEKASLAYWVKDGNYNVAEIKSTGDRFDRRTFFDVTINGKTVRAVLDSGATATLLSRRAATRAGVDLNAPDVAASINSIGIGGRPVRTWTAKVDSFSVGTETIQHSQMQIIDGDIGDNTDMLLGVDFLLAHHMFIANSKKVAYFTYNGGRVFTFATAPADGGKSGAVADGNGNAPKTAADYALLGQAHLSRGELSAALSHLDEAIRMAPEQAAYYVARAKVHEANRQPEAAIGDLDKSLNLDPKNVDALLMRARLRIAHEDRAGAMSDVAAASALVPPGSTRALPVAVLYVELEQPAAALPLLDDWIRLHRDDAMLGTALNERCWARGLSNQWLDDALKDCRRALRRDGNNASYLDSLGLVELRLGHYDEAIKAYEQALTQMPHSAWSRYGLGLAKLRSGQTDAGKADMAAAHALDGNIEARAGKFGLTATGP
ncbi:hypothetical protein CA260_06585 [Dyella jiangningensis]|uniref:Peptidase A2 domain-containing protein n=1 Tax=Dyella jiangningensis TaxID=1379159 RepID=A0A328P8L1_9GAMM|nr:hypothetical protein CA260_06585 [Dyella jiangningensis]